MEELFKIELEKGISELKILIQEISITGNIEKIETMYRVAHTLKGSCKLMGEEELVSLFHDLESKIDALLHGENTIEEIENLLTKLTNNEETVSISSKELDKVMEIVEELFRLSNKFMESDAGTARGIEKIAFNLQSFVLLSRFVPISSVINKIVEAGYLMASDLNKVICIESSHKDTRIDKLHEPAIYGALLHLMRNAIDHGIETIQEREMNNKNLVGKIVIEAKNIARGIEIIVKDDGRGIDKEKLIQKAKKINDNTDLDIIELLALPISSKDEVTEYSGRGRGMGAAIDQIKKIGGQMTVNTEKGRFTEFRIFIPTQRPFDKYLVFERSALFALPVYTVDYITDTIEIINKDIAVWNGKPKKIYDPLDIGHGIRYIISDNIYVADKIVGIASAYKKDEFVVVKNTPALLVLE